MSRYRQIGGKRAVLHASIGSMTIPAELIAEAAADFPCPPLGAAELSAAEAERMAGMFKALADPVRLRIFSRAAAHQSGEASACDLQNVGVSQPTVGAVRRRVRRRTAIRISCHVRATAGPEHPGPGPGRGLPTRDPDPPGS